MPTPTFQLLPDSQKQFDVDRLRLNYAGAIGLLCELSLQVDDEARVSIEDAVKDFCTLTGWEFRRILNRIEVFPPPTDPPAPAPAPRKKKHARKKRTAR